MNASAACADLYNDFYDCQPPSSECYVDIAPLPVKVVDAPEELRVDVIISDDSSVGIEAAKEASVSVPYSSYMPRSPEVIEISD